MSDSISNKDKKDWEDFLKSKNKVPNKDYKIQSRHKHKKKTIDLHGYTLDNANTEIEKFILNCFENGVTKISIITGKGTRSKNIGDPYQSKDLSILKYSVPSFIKDNKDLMSKIIKIDNDAIESPSKGNFDIILRKKSD